MATIKCDYYDKNLKPVDSLGNMSVSRSDLAHALLQLDGIEEAKGSRILNYIIDLLTTFNRFTFPLHGELCYKPRPKDAMDSCKKEDSDKFAAAFTVLVAEKIYHHAMVFPLFEKTVVFKNKNNRERPDFFATNGITLSLFESKGCFSEDKAVSSQQVKKGISQLNSISAVRDKQIGLITSFKEKVVVATGLQRDSQGHQQVACKIYDPENVESTSVDINVFGTLKSYYSFVRQLVDSPEGIEKGKKELKNRSLIVSTMFKIKSLWIEIGLLDEIYRNAFKGEYDFYRVLKEIRDSDFGLYSDGVYLKVHYDRDFFPGKASYQIDH